MLLFFSYFGSRRMQTPPHTTLMSGPLLGPVYPTFPIGDSSPLMSQHPQCRVARACASPMMHSPVVRAGTSSDKVGKMLVDFYRRYKPEREARVPAIVAEFVRRGGGNSELAALNEELRQVLTRTLMQLEHAFALQGGGLVVTANACSLISFLWILLLHALACACKSTCSPAPFGFHKDAAHVDTPQVYGKDLQDVQQDLNGTKFRASGRKPPSVFESRVCGQVRCSSNKLRVSYCNHCAALWPGQSETYS